MSMTSSAAPGPSGPCEARAARTSSQQRRPVRQAGQVVVTGPPGHGLLLAHPLGDVGVGDDDPRRALHARGLQPEPGRRQGPSWAEYSYSKEPAGASTGSDRKRVHGGLDRGVVLGAQPPRHGREVVVADAAGLDPAAPEQFTVGDPGPVHRQDPAVAVHQHGRRGQRLQDGGELARLVVPSPRRTDLLVDVPDDHRQPPGVGIGAHLEPVVPALVQVLEHPGAARRRGPRRRSARRACRGCSGRHRGTGAPACPPRRSPAWPPRPRSRR